MHHYNDDQELHINSITYLHRFTRVTVPPTITDSDITVLTPRALKEDFLTSAHNYRPFTQFYAYNQHFFSWDPHKALYTLEFAEDNHPQYFRTNDITIMKARIDALNAGQSL
jgi:hypothetical protein